MISTGWTECFPLTHDTINYNLTKTSPGAYALGNLRGNTFYVEYVGRSDSDLAERLKCWVGSYSHFKAGYFDSPLAAFKKECDLYHDFKDGGLDNKVHPDRPNGSGWKCHRCYIFG